MPLRFFREIQQASVLKVEADLSCTFSRFVCKHDLEPCRHCPTEFAPFPNVKDSPSCDRTSWKHAIRLNLSRWVLAKILDTSDLARICW